MKNLLMFHGSCGHTTVEEVTDERWLKFATEFGHGPPGPAEFPNRSRTGKRTRMAYVHPFRFCICVDCAKAGMEDYLYKLGATKLSSLDELFGKTPLAQYRDLEAQLKLVRLTNVPGSNVEDPILYEMDRVWYKLSESERQMLDNEGPTCWPDL